MPDQLDIHLYHHVDTGHVDRMLDRILTHVRAIEAQGERLMAASQEIRDAMGRIDAATNTIATRLQTLADQIKAGMTPAEVQEVVTGLQAEATKLEGLGANPENPVP